ncbi:MAG: hypothetical protein ABIG39_03105 [Candidatus Micrarchaeota archaeon]
MRYRIIALLLLAVLYGCTQTSTETSSRGGEIEADTPITEHEVVYAQINAGNAIDGLDEFYYSEIEFDELDESMEFKFNEGELE